MQLDFKFDLTESVKDLLTVALDIVVDEVTRVGALVSPGEAALAMLAPFNVHSLVGGAIGPGL